MLRGCGRVNFRIIIRALRRVFVARLQHLSRFRSNTSETPKNAADAVGLTLRYCTASRLIDPSSGALSTVTERGPAECQRRPRRRRTTGAGDEKDFSDCSRGGALCLRSFWRRPETGEGSAYAASSAESMGPRLRWCHHERLYVAWYHPVGTRPVGDCLYRAALQRRSMAASLRRHLGREHPVPESRRNGARPLRRCASDLRSGRLRFWVLVLRLSGRPVLL